MPTVVPTTPVTISERDTTAYRFGPYEFGAVDAELRCDGATVRLARKPAELLLLLLRNRDRIVPRDEIFAALWPAVRVSEAAFHSAVRDLRRALSDDGRKSRLVSTIRGRGLRFVGAVEVRVTDTRLLTPPSEAYVGRKDILARLRAGFDSARRGAGRVVLLGGQPGVGKTRTAREIADHARGLGAAIHYGRCWRPGFAPPYRPWVELLESMGERIGAAERVAMMGPKLGHLARMVPALGAPAESAGSEPQARFEAFDAIAVWLQRYSRSTATLLVLDDLEDADPASLDLLEFLAGRLSDSRVLLLGNFRTCAAQAELPLFATLQRLTRLPHFEQIRLSGFDRGESRRFLTALAGREMREDEVDTLQQRTDGNPLLLRLFARSLETAEADPQIARTIPSTVREWIRGQLLALPPACVDCLQAAATIGRLFDDSILARMVAREPAGIEESLTLARRAGLVDETGDQIHCFSHTLLQEAIYDAIPLAGRAELHRRAAEAIQARYPELLAGIARHLMLAVDLVGEPAIEAAERAADLAEHRLAFEEAVRLRDMALDALRAVGSPDPRRRCELLVGRGRALLAARRVAETWDTARKAVALAREIGSADLFARGALLFTDFVLPDSGEVVDVLEEALRRLPPESTDLRAQIACRLSMALWYYGEPERRRALAQEAQRIARELDDARLETSALLTERHVLHSPEHLAERIRLASEAIAVAERNGLDSARCEAIEWRAIDLLERGDAIGAQIDVDAVERLVASELAPGHRAFPERWRAIRATLAGRFPDAEVLIREAHERMQRGGDRNADTYAGIQTGLLLQEQGRGSELAHLLSSAPWIFPLRERMPSVAAAIALVELEAGSPAPARRLLDATSASDWMRLRKDAEMLGTASWVAEIATQLGDASSAASLHDLLEPYGDRIVVFYGVACRGSFARYLGMLARTAGRTQCAERWFERAVAANRAIEATLYVAWSQWEWAETIALDGDPRGRGRARALAAKASQTARGIGLGRLLEAMRRSRATSRLGAVAPAEGPVARVPQA